MWEGKKGEDGKRLCPLCNKMDGAEHILLECEEVNDLRSKIKANISEFNLTHTLKIKDLLILKEIGSFLAQVRNKRKGKRGNG